MSPIYEESKQPHSALESNPDYLNVSQQSEDDLEESVPESENSMYFDRKDADFNHARQNTLTVMRKATILKQKEEMKEAVRDEESDFASDNTERKQVQGVIKGNNGHYYHLTIEAMDSNFALTLTMEKGKVICRRKTIPRDFVYFEMNLDEDISILLQACKERIQTLLRDHVGEIDISGGQISDDFFDTNKIPERVGRSL